MIRIVIGAILVLFTAFGIVAHLAAARTVRPEFLIQLALLPGLPGAALLWWGIHARRVRPPAPPPVTKRIDPDDAAAELLAIYSTTREGFYPTGQGAQQDRVREIGRLLDADGGKPLMREVHALFARQCSIVGGARNLEIMWHEIGTWQG